MLINPKGSPLYIFWHYATFFDEMLCVDEQIVPTKTRRTTLRQYNPKKPKKWGFKIFMLCGQSGIVHNIEFNFGKDHNREEPSTLSASCAVVARLASIVPDHGNFKLFYDNWFSSLELLEELSKRSIFTLSTIRFQRIPSLSFPSDTEMRKTLGRGGHIEKQADFGESAVISAVKWFDNKGVHLMSNFVGAEPTTKVQRYDRKTKTFLEIDCPQIVRTYNKFMGGIDSFDAYIALYRIKIKTTTKFHKRIFFHILDMFIVNAWLLYRRDCSDLGVPKREWRCLWDFKAEVAEYLSRGGSLKRQRFSEVSHGYLIKIKRGKAAPLPAESIRRDGLDHLVRRSSTRGMCKYPGCGSKVYTICHKCSNEDNEIHLCASQNDCFYTFHIN